MSTEHDTEYGPTPPGAQYEHTDIDVSIGYNFAGFRDDDFEASRYTAQGPYIKFRMKADQDTFKDLSLDALRSGRHD